MVNGMDIKERPLEVKKQIGFVPDSPNMFLRLKGIEYLNFMADMYDVSSEDRKELIDTLGREFDMGKVLGDRIQSYSHSSSFYFSKDVESLLPLPLKPRQIVGAKFLAVAAYEYLITAAIFLPIMIIYGIKSASGVLFYIYGSVAFKI
jgi:hypothetical protein